MSQPNRGPNEPGQVIRAAAASMMVFGGAWLAPSGALAQQPGTEVVSTYVRELHGLVNRHRSSAGCGPLAWHEGAARVAEAHSEDMARRDYFDHTSPEGTDLTRRLLSGGVSWRGSIAENIALTVRGPEVVLELWVESEPHRENLDDCSFTHHGLGLFRDRWTQVLIEDPGDPDATL